MVRKRREEKGSSKENCSVGRILLQLYRKGSVAIDNFYNLTKEDEEIYNQFIILFINLYTHLLQFCHSSGLSVTYSHVNMYII